MMFGKKGKIRKLFQKKTRAENFYEELEDCLIEADVSPLIAFQMIEELKVSAPRNADDVLQFIRTKLEGLIHTRELIPPSPDPTEADPAAQANPTAKTGCWLFLGVNGSGKTTSLAKTAHYLKNRGTKIILAAGDTFRAAAAEQLERHAENLNVRCIGHGDGANPGAVIFDAIEHAKSQSKQQPKQQSEKQRSAGTIVLADSAGRMHTKSQLMQELQKIDRIISNKIDREHYRKLLVLDATTGQNGMQQAETFHETLGIDGIILSKYDSGAGGGLALSISQQLNIPFVFLGNGEKYEDIAPFTADAVIDRIMMNLEGDDR